MISLAEQLKEVRREIAKRESVYPRWVAERKLSQRSADTHLNAMRAVADTLKPLAEAEEAAARANVPELPLGGDAA